MPGLCFYRAFHLKQEVDDTEITAAGVCMVKNMAFSSILFRKDKWITEYGDQLAQTLFTHY